MKEASIIVPGLQGNFLLVGTPVEMTHVYFPGTFDPKQQTKKNIPQLLQEAARQWREYWEGQRRTFNLPLIPARSTFQQSVRNALLEVPFAKTVSYGELACMAGSPRAARAAGAACHANLLPIIVPCHRVIGANGQLKGFAFGNQWKQTLLNWEKTWI